MDARPNPTADLMDERGYYPMCALSGEARVLADLVSHQVDLHGGPVPIEEIRKIVRSEITHQSYDEHHYYEHSQWFVRMTFSDDSHITWGLDDA